MFSLLTQLALPLLTPLSVPLYSRNKTSLPFLCIVTPIFDPGLPSLKPLIADLQKQSFPDFIHVMVSNGISPKSKKYLSGISRRDPRFIYLEMKRGREQTWQQLQVNLGSRKNYVFKHFDAERYVIVDADSSIVDRHFIAKLYLAHFFLKKDILIARIKLKGQTLPQFPVRMGTIDMCNYTFSRGIAKSAHYPTDPWKYFYGTDFLFFRDINTPSNTSFLPFTYLHKDARRSYQSVSEKIKSNLNQ